MALTIPKREQLKPIAKRYGLRLIVLFGSQVTGRTHAESDVDVAVLAQRALSPSKRLALWSDLSRVLKADVDLTLLDRASPVLSNRIARNHRLLYEAKRRDWEKYRSYMLRRYWDAGKFIDATQRYVARRTREMRRAR